MKRSAGMSRLPRTALMDARVAGLEVVIAGTGYTGEDGFEVVLPEAEAPAFWRALADAGVAQGVGDGDQAGFAPGGADEGDADGETEDGAHGDGDTGVAGDGGGL